MMKVGFIVVALLMLGIVSGDISTGEVSPAPSPTEHYSSPPQMSPSPIEHYSSPPQMSPSHSPSNYEPESPTMPDTDYSNPPTSQSPEAGELNHTDVTGTEGQKSSGGGKMAGIAVGAIAAASMVGVGGYVLKKRRENIRRSRYEYAATEIL